MKTNLLVVLIVLFLLAGFPLSGCTALGGGNPTALPTIVLGDPNATHENPGAGEPPGGQGVVTASGVIAPRQETRMVFTLAGKVKAVEAEVGDRVTAGQILVLLEGQEDLEAAVRKAEYELEQARQSLADLQEESQAMRIQAMQDVITYEKAVRDAQYALDNFTVPSNQANLDTVEALNLMKQHLDEAREAFEPYKYRPSSDQTREDRKEALDEAQADYNAAVKRLQYEYDLEVVQEKLARALEDYETLSSGPDPDKARMAEMRQASAESQLSAARAALEHLTLSAPFDGTISQINAHSGEWVIPGQVILVLADLDHLRVETTDLSERDIPQVKIGQAVTVFIKALGKTVMGKVTDIAPLADVLGGDVVYKTTIDLETYPEGLRSGMSVEVQFEEEN